MEVDGSIDHVVVAVVKEMRSRYLRGIESQINGIHHEVKIKKGKSGMTSRFLV